MDAFGHGPRALIRDLNGLWLRELLRVGLVPRSAAWMQLLHVFARLKRSSVQRVTLTRLFVARCSGLGPLLHLRSCQLRF
jgi:hypothetical protein